MTTFQLDSGALEQLSHDQKGILDAVDSLRNLGVGKLVNLPQIIVIGDQSSGKSSVLEAISKVRFPVKGGLCTRFATELVLRRKPSDEVVVKIRNAAEGADRPGFSEKRFDKDDLPALIEKAKAAMGVDDSSTAFSGETLRVEISGPDMMPLTLIDLPGFYHAGTSEQSREGMAIVSRLATRYMKQKNSIILAVLSAKNEISQQKVLDEIRQYDANRERTIGIITKPDTLTPQSYEEEKYLQLARNKEPTQMLKHGWHVLRNRNGEENDERNSGKDRIPDVERDDKEAHFFQAGVWSSLPSSHKGIDSLRRKLSKVLTVHIQDNLPTVVQDIQDGLDTRRDLLRGLGQPRSTPLEMRQYLGDIFTRFRDLITAGVKGTYEGNFFAKGPGINGSHVQEMEAHGDPRKFRAIARNLNRAFTTVMSSSGAKFRLTGNGFQDYQEQPGIPAPLRGWVQSLDVRAPSPLAWTMLKSRLELRASNNQGTRFPGSPNDKLALELFREQSERWKGIATKHTQLTIGAARNFVELVLCHVIPSDSNTREGILTHYIDPFFDARLEDLRAKTDELLMHYLEGDAICLEDEFLGLLSEHTRLRLNNEARHSPEYDETTEGLQARLFVSANAAGSHASLGGLGLEGIVDMMTAYYDMSLRTFTDNVIVLAVENCLVRKLPELLNLQAIYAIEDEMLEQIAGENNEIREERKVLSDNIEVLGMGLQVLKKHLPRPLIANSLLPAIDAARRTDVSVGTNLFSTPRHSSGIDGRGSSMASASSPSSSPLTTTSTPKSGVAPDTPSSLFNSASPSPGLNLFGSGKSPVRNKSPPSLSSSSRSGRQGLFNFGPILAPESKRLKT